MNIRNKGQCKDNVGKSLCIFPHKNDWETPYISIYIDLQSINFNLLSVLLHCVYQQVVIMKSILH